MSASVSGQGAPAPAESKSIAWSDEDVNTLISMRDKGHSNAEIARRLGRQENAVAVKATRLHLPSRNFNPSEFTNPNAKMRPCLCCSKQFFSEGHGNRICDPCKSSSAWSSGSYAVSIGGW